MSYFVDIIELEPRAVEHTLGPYESWSVACRAEDGVNRNLNHEKYCTVIRAEKEAA